jgi:outer membrane lipoprotein-sorting protein
MGRGLTAFAGIVILGLGTVVAAAEAVPLPTPAPLPKTGAIPAQQVPADMRVAPPANINDHSSNAAGGDQPTTIGRFLSGLGKTGQTTAFDPTQRALIDRVSAYLSGVRTLVGNFVQVAPDGSRTQGEFYLQKPGRLRFEYDDPSPIELIADGSSVVVRDRKLATQDLYPLSQTPLRFLLADRVDLLKDTNVVSVTQDDTFVTTVIEEKSIGGTNRVMLMFGAQDLTLRQWTITDPQGYDTTVAVYNLDTSKKPDPGLFKINYDPNTRPSNN